MELYQIITLIIISILLVNAFGFAAIYIHLYDAWDTFIPMPSDFKCYTNMNWFGCIICYIGLFILFPIENICKFVYWLFHV